MNLKFLPTSHGRHHASTSGCSRSLIMCGVFTLLSIAGCAGKSNPHLGEDGIYRFAGHPIEVRAPDRCVLDLYTYDSPQAVEFITGRGYWDAGGRYTVHVFPVPNEVTDKASFEARAARFFQRFMVEEPAQYKVNVKPVSQSPLMIDGNYALRAIAVDQGRAVFVATARWHRSRISIASLLFPIDGAASPETQIPWACYDQFVTSVRETS